MDWPVFGIVAMGLVFVVIFVSVSSLESERLWAEMPDCEGYCGCLIARLDFAEENDIGMVINPYEHAGCLNYLAAEKCESRSVD